MESKEICSTPEELEIRKTWWCSQSGIKIIDFQDIARGEFGFFTIRDDEQQHKVIYRPFGELRVLERIAPGPQAIVDSYNVHSIHTGQFWRISCPTRLLKGFACYCEASSGISHVMLAKLSILKGLVEPPDGMDFAVAKNILDWIRLRDDVDVLKAIIKAHQD
ncbi:MAG TPA: hypothetical protein VIE65_10875 [Methylobacter sp.]|jgi:hypothetical protein